MSGSKRGLGAHHWAEDAASLRGEIGGSQFISFSSAARCAYTNQRLREQRKRQMPRGLAFAQKGRGKRDGPVYRGRAGPSALRRCRRRRAASRCCWGARTPPCSAVRPSVCICTPTPSSSCWRWTAGRSRTPRRASSRAHWCGAPRTSPGALRALCAAELRSAPGTGNRSQPNRKELRSNGARTSAPSSGWRMFRSRAD